MKTLTAMAAVSALLSMCNPSQVPDVRGLPCQQWAAPALAAGWQPEHLPRLLPIIHRESRCDPKVVRYNQSSGRPIDVGLTQINQVHQGMLAQRGFTHLDMRDANANLFFAKVLFDWHEDRGMCGWRPWRGRC
jgi:hypothetical protein